MSVDFNFKDIDIVNCLYRKPPARKPVIVRFTTHPKKQEFYKGRFMLKEVNLSLIVQLEVNEVGSKIFINENLTARHKGIMAAAWKMKKNGQFDSMEYGWKDLCSQNKQLQAKHDQRSKRLNSTHLTLLLKLPLKPFFDIFSNRFSACIFFLSAFF